MTVSRRVGDNVPCELDVPNSKRGAGGQRLGTAATAAGRVRGELRGRRPPDRKHYILYRLYIII